MCNESRDVKAAEVKQEVSRRVKRALFVAMYGCKCKTQACGSSAHRAGSLQPRRHRSHKNAPQLVSITTAMDA